MTFQVHTARSHVQVWNQIPRHVCYLAKFSCQANLLKKDTQDSSAVLYLYLGTCTYKRMHTHTSAWTETKPFCLQIQPSVSWAVLWIPFLYLKSKDKILKSSACLHLGTQATATTSCFFSPCLQNFFEVFFEYVFLLFIFVSLHMNSINVKHIHSLPCGDCDPPVLQSHRLSSHQAHWEHPGNLR